MSGSGRALDDPTTPPNRLAPSNLQAPSNPQACEPPGPGRSPGIDRRRALELLLGGSSLAVAALVGFPVARYLRPLAEDERDAVASFPQGELAVWDARLVAVAGRPVVVVNTGAGYAALSAACTHLGCVVKWKRARRQLFCPCHGARFDLAGDVLGGPARGPLEKLEASEEAGMVVVRRT